MCQDEDVVNVKGNQAPRRTFDDNGDSFCCRVLGFQPLSLMHDVFQAKTQSNGQ